MKNIELNNKQKENLLEMCKKLFPLSKIQFTDDFYCEWSLFLTTEDDYDQTFPENNVDCHWFEFCMTHLITKLNLKWYNYTRWQSEEGETHIVDYLYKQFKIYEKN